MSTAYISPAATAEGSMREQIALTRNGLSLQEASAKALKAAVGLWFVVAVLGQLIFASYIVVSYGGPALRWDFSAWNKTLFIGYKPGDKLGNIVLAMHLALAVVITVGGPIQFIPQLRNRAPSLHRWNGRIYILTAFIISLAGLYGLWFRGPAFGTFAQHVATSINAVLIMVCAAMALRYAVARKFAVHRRWALRLFLVSSGVWFVRIATFLSSFLNSRFHWFDAATFNGPFMTVLNFGQFLVPLGVLELYFRARDGADVAARIAMTALLFVLTVAMGTGIFLITKRMWLPRIY